MDFVLEFTTNLNTALNDIQAPMNELSRSFDLGVQKIENLIGFSKDLKAGFQDVSASFSQGFSLDAVQQGVSKTFDLIEQGANSFSFIPGIDKMNEQVQGFSALTEGQIGGVISKVSELGSAFGLNGTEMGGFKETMKGVGGAIDAMLPGMGSMNKESLKSIKIIAQQNLNLLKSNALKGINFIWTGVVAGATAAWTGVQWLLNTALNANPIGLIILGITALVAAVAWLTDGFSGFGDFFTKFWEGLKEWFWKLVEFWNTYLNPFSWILELIDTIFPGAKDSILGFFSNLWDSIYNTFIQPLVDAWQKLKSLFGFGDDEVNAELEAKVEHHIEEPKQPPKAAVDKGYANLPYGTESDSNLDSAVPSLSEKATGVGKATSGNQKGRTSINTLVENINIQVPELSMAKGKIKEMVKEALLGAVRDFEIATN